MKPMKGVAFTEKRLLQWLEEDGSVWMQPKRDEIRCIVHIHGLMEGNPSVTYRSASDKPLYNLECFDTRWLTIARATGYDLFDCGVMVDNSFDVTRSVLRSSKKKYDLSERAVFWLYDLPSSPDSFFLRQSEMACIAADYRPMVDMPSTMQAYTLQGVEEFTADYLAAGHEGAMVKREDFAYKQGRSTDWMKRKPEEEADGYITGYVPGKGKYEGMVGSLILMTSDGVQVRVSGMTDAQRATVSDSAEFYIGRVVEIKYMMRDSQDGYRHPRFHRFHPDKEMKDVQADIDALRTVDA